MPRILYAEDNAGMRRMVCCFLEAAGLDVVAVTDGDEAIEAAELERFDIILLDVTMERIDGLDAAKLIRKSTTPNANLPIIGLTGRSEEQEILECQSAGMSIVLTKPVNLELLLETVCNAHEIIANQNKTNGDLQIDNQISEEKPNLKIIDISVLAQYRLSVGISATEGILRDFSDIWPRKIGELYTSILNKEHDKFARSAEELGAAAAGIGASKVAFKISAALSETCFDKRAKMLPDTATACEEVQAIINALAEPYDSDNIAA